MISSHEELERDFPGIRQYGCYDPFEDFREGSYKCKNCPRSNQCREDSKFLSRQLDNFGRSKDVDGRYCDDRAMRMEIERKRKLIKIKPKRKICSCKKK